jgi:hypothetical protein
VIRRAGRRVVATVRSVAERVGYGLLRAGHWFTCPYCKGVGGERDRIYTREAYASAEAVCDERDHAWNEFRWQGFVVIGYRIVVGGRHRLDGRDRAGRRVVGGRTVKRVLGSRVVARFPDEDERQDPPLRVYAMPLDGDFTR